jgi:hypothetical protein
LVEPLGAYRAEALDVYRTAKLHEVMGYRSALGRKPDTIDITLSVWKIVRCRRSDDVEHMHASLAGRITRCVPCGNPWASCQTHPRARGTMWEKKRGRGRSDILRKFSSGKGVAKRQGCTAHIERVYEPVKLLDANVLHGAPPVNAIKDHLLRLGRIVSASLQKPPIKSRARETQSMQKKNE